MITNQLELNKQIYRRYIDLLNTKNFDALPQVTDPAHYQEICVGFTPGWVNMAQALVSLQKVLVGIPDLNAQIEDVTAEGDKVYARLKVRGTQKGTLFGMPATHKRYEVQMFDYALIKQGKIVERIQQSDNLGQFIILFKTRAITLSLALAMLITGLVTALLIR